MDDMSAVIIAKSDQINSDDLVSGPITITITGVAISAGTEQPVSIKFAESADKVFRPCKTVSRVLVAAWGADAKNYVGRSATLYRDPKVKWGGLEVGGIRVSHLSHIDRDMTVVLKESRAHSKPVIIRPLKASPAPAKASQTPSEPDDGLTPEPFDAPAWAKTWRALIGAVIDDDGKAALRTAWTAATTDFLAAANADPDLAKVVKGEVAAAVRKTT